MRLRVVRNVVAAVALASATAAHAACSLGVMATLPITMQGLRPTTVAQINGRDAPFLVDSGSFFGVISPASAQQYGLRLSSAPTGLYIRAIGGSATPSVANIRKFTVAGQTLDNIPFLVAGSEIGQGDTGVIGYNVLGIGDAEYDLAHGMVRLIKPSGCVRADFPFWKYDHGAAEIAIEPGVNVRENRIVATAYVNGTSMRVVFDTGASTTVMTRAAAKRAGIDVDGPDARAGGVGMGFGKRLVRQWIVPVASFKIGDEEIRQTRLRVSETLIEGADAPDMLLGADFFLSHHIYVSKNLHKLYLTYNGGNVFNLKAVEAPPPATVAAVDPAAATGTVAAPPAGAASAMTPAPAPAAEPASAEDLARRGAASAARREYGAAIADLTKAIALAPNEPRYLSERAAAYAGNRQPYLAMTDYDAALKLAPNDVSTLMRRAQARLAGRDKTGAAADLAAIDAAAAKEADVRFYAGELYERMDNLAAALAQYDLWLAVHRDDNKAAAAYANRCRTRALIGSDLDGAAKDCATARRREPGNLVVVDSQALIELRRGDYAHAIADYDAVLAKLPKRAWALYGRGLAKLASGSADAGNADVAAARDIAPDLPAFARAHGIGPAASAAPATAAPANPG